MSLAATLISTIHSDFAKTQMYLPDLGNCQTLLFSTAHASGIAMLQFFELNVYIRVFAMHLLDLSKHYLYLV